MDIDIVTTASVGAVTSVVSGWFAWLLSKKKYNTEVKFNELENLKKSLDFYEEIVKDNNKKLTFYIKLAEDNRIEVFRLKGVVHYLMNSACVNQGCTSRQFYTEAEIKSILGETYVGEPEPLESEK